MCMQHAQYMSLFLVLMVNSNQFQISWSYIHTLTLATVLMCSYNCCYTHSSPLLVMGCRADLLLATLHILSCILNIVLNAVYQLTLVRAWVCVSVHSHTCTHRYGSPV